jgi:excinuclease ABC subunit A
MADRIEGLEKVDKVIDIDQAPIGRTPRSNPATYIKLWDEIRSLYAEMPDAKVRGYQPGRFSFNKPGGRCEACEGNGSNRLEMDFLADVWVTCPVCEGRRFNRETLQVRTAASRSTMCWKWKWQEALDHFEHIPKIRDHAPDAARCRARLHQAGAASPTLSGGEAQRIKLAKELCPPRHRQDALHPGRADHRPALRGRPESCWMSSTDSSSRATPCS